MATVAPTASSHLTGIHLRRVEWVRMSSLCWFCLDELNKAHNTHHILPRRYFANKQQAHYQNTVKVCIGCHEAWNRIHDKPRFSLEHYLAYMTELDWGFGALV